MTRGLELGSRQNPSIMEVIPLLIILIFPQYRIGSVGFLPFSLVIGVVRAM